MPAFNYAAAQQYPHVANDTGYTSPVAELLNSLKGRQTTSNLLPMGIDPNSLLQGLGSIQNQMESDKASRFGLVSNRIETALRNAEEDALQRRIEAQNKLMAQQAAIQQTPSSNGYTSPYSGNTGFTPSLPFTGLPQMPNSINPPVVAKPDDWIKFPSAKPKSPKDYLKPYMKTPKIPSSIAKPSSTKKKSTKKTGTKQRPNLRIKDVNA